MTLSSSMAMYSVMRDRHDARRVPWQEDELLFTYRPHAKYSNQLNLEQWAFKNGLLLF